MVYFSVVKALKHRIHSTEFMVGDKLPSEKQLAAFYQVSRNTLRKAIAQLETEGLVNVKHGSGTYIASKPFSVQVSGLKSFSEIVQASGQNVTNKILQFKVIPATQEIASQLNIQINELVYYVKRIRSVSNTPLQLEETWLAVEKFPDLSMAHMTSSKFSYIENECGIKIAGCYETFSSCLPSPEQAHLLKMSMKDPVIRMQTQAVDLAGNPLDYSILHSNIYEFQIKYFLPRG